MTFSRLMLAVLLSMSVGHAVVFAADSDDERLSKKEIEDVMRANLSDIEVCFNTHLGKRKDVSTANVMVKFVVEPGGKVVFADLQSSSVRSAGLRSCFVNEMRGWRFPPKSTKENLTVTYPFNYNRN